MSLVYFIQAGAPVGPVKIGYTTNLEKRLEQLKTSNHAELTVLFSLNTETPRDLEEMFHRLFSNLRLRGEWFRWHQDIGEAIEVLKRIEGSLGPGPVRVDFTLVRIPGGGVRSVPKGKGPAVARRLNAFTPTVCVFLNASEVDLQDKSWLFQFGKPLTNFVDRREGVIVVDLATSEIWRAKRGSDLVPHQRLETTLNGTASTYIGPASDLPDADLFTKLCIECGAELTDDVVRTSGETPTDGRFVRLHFCEAHPSEGLLR